ncbi:hypothetical protein ACFP2T_25660 [Plantactinospora solaniradicis]|uniref:Uncharacterized protein n=1 Tax=Plantactinospora solaniradicis TaxID=1723736 RepID=A0ABW1KGT9_9ACTN
MHTGVHRYQLSVGFHGSRAIRAVLVAVLGGMAALASGCLGLIIGMMMLWVVPDEPSTPKAWAYLPFALAGVLTTAVVIYVVLTMTFGIRLDAWLEGTRLTVRGLRQRTVDLAAARTVALRRTNQRLVAPVRRSGVVGPTQSVALLVVTTDAGAVRLRLATREGIQLPPEQLLALANALSVARCPGATEVVAWLRGTAVHVQSGP